MAELIASALLSSVFQVIGDRIVSRDFKHPFNKALVKKLQVTLNFINELLDDAETKQYQNSRVKNWLDDLKHVMYEVYQLLDEIALEHRKSKKERFLSAWTNQFASRMKDLLVKLENFANQKDILGLKKEGRYACNELEVRPNSSIRIPSTSLVDESNICGRVDDKDKIINFLLLDNGSSSHAPIISIVGLGGMGKTTLAQLVFNNDMIQNSFDLKAWVNVSESFNVVGLTKKILESFDCSPTSENLETLQPQLQERLTGKKCLLVLDDVWNGDWEIWDRFLLPFNKGSSGSKIIVTTRNREVAKSMKSYKLHDLKRLEESDCWRLFEKHAFHNRNVSEHPIFKSIGKNIVDKCGGLPLAIKTLGNLLQRKFCDSHWKKILETDLWCLLDHDGKIPPALRLSYHYLPSNLKHCFTYCSIFPKGYVFEKNTLINLWKAEGLLKFCRRGRRDKTEEELGNELFDDLESISFLEQEINVHGESIYVMHDVVNDLAKSESQKFCLQIDEGDKVQDICEKTRHIWCSLDLKDDARISQQICKFNGLRSLLVETKGYSGEPIMISNNLQHDIFSKLKYLRMLSFRGCELTELSDKIGNLKLLRYLDLTRTNIKSLPDSISELYNLETLLLEGTDIMKMPKKIGRLNQIQTLSHFVVAEKRECDIKELGNLNLLEGKLCVSGLQHVIDPADAAEANMKDKKHLEELILQYSDSLEVNNNGRELDVLEALQPNSNLKKLTIENYNANCFPNWLRGCDLSNLVSLKLKSCGLCSQLPPLGQLPCLKELSISQCVGIKTIGKEFYDNNNSTSLVPFRSLEFLKFEKMDNLEEWLCIQGSPLLKILYIGDCAELKRVPPQHLPSLQQLWMSNCNKLEEFLCLEGSPLLKELYISECPKLKRAPLPQHLPSLQKLIIYDCQMMEASIPKGDSMIELDLQRCDRILVNGLSTSLKKFTLWGNGYTEFIVQQNLVNCTILEELNLDLRGWGDSLDLCCYNSLRHLSIRGCDSSSLPSFSLHSFTNLQSLMLYDCLQLESLPSGGLPANLRELGIYNCPKVIGSREEWGLFQLNSLWRFTISYAEFENVESFPEENLLPPTLERLELRNCSKLRIMNNKGFLHLNSLEWLFIFNCPSLESLPEEGLKSLEWLSISESPIIREKYKKEGGEHWPTITHIPSVWIDIIDQHEE